MLLGRKVFCQSVGDHIVCLNPLEIYISISYLFSQPMLIDVHVT